MHIFALVTHVYVHIGAVSVSAKVHDYVKVCVGAVSAELCAPVQWWQVQNYMPVQHCTCNSLVVDCNMGYGSRIQ